MTPHIGAKDTTVLDGRTLGKVGYLISQVVMVGAACNLLRIAKLADA